MKETVEQYLLIATAIACGVISLLHIFGLLESVHWVEEQTPALTLLVVGLIAGHLVIERRGKLNEIEHQIREGVERTIASLEGAEVKSLMGTEQLFIYYRRRIRAAQKSVDDLTWGPVDPTYATPAAARAFKKYLEEVPKVCSKARRISYREVMTFPTLGRLERAEQMIAKNLECYNLKYYDIPHEGMPPFLQFFIIDSEEVIFAFYRYPYLPAAGRLHLAVKHPAIVRVFQDYYNSIWQGAKVLKEGGRVNMEEINKIRQRLEV